MSLLRHSRVAALLTKLGWVPVANPGLIGKGLNYAWKKKMPIIGAGLVAGATGMGVNDALNRSRAGATPEWVEHSRNRGVPAAPKF